MGKKNNQPSFEMFYSFQKATNLGTWVGAIRSVLLSKIIHLPNFQLRDILLGMINGIAITFGVDNALANVKELYLQGHAMMNEHAEHFKEVAVDNLKNFLTLEILKRMVVENDPQAIQHAKGDAERKAVATIALLEKNLEKPITSMRQHEMN